jgi:hypothetical protein
MTGTTRRGIGFYIEYAKTRDQVVQDYDGDGKHIGWTCKSQPPPGPGRRKVPSRNNLYKTLWRRFIPAINGVRIDGGVLRDV